LELLFELFCDGVMAEDVVAVRIYRRRALKFGKALVVLGMFRSFELLGARVRSGCFGVREGSGNVGKRKRGQQLNS
jgi:hypothetical protein